MKNKGVTRLRRVIALILISLIILALSGCKPLNLPENESISVYATFYPVYAMTEAVMDGVPNMELHCMAQPQDGCLRAYQLSDWDTSLLASGADAVIMGGRGLESFESDLFGWGDDGPAISAVLYNLELYNQQEKVDGESESHLKGPNPHLYMSLPGAKRIIESISATMASLDPQYAQSYGENAEKAAARLDELYSGTRSELAEYAGQPVILMNEALIYVAGDYDLAVAEWIDRESGASMGDSELSTTLDRLAQVEARVVLIEKQAPQRLVEALEAAGYAVARIDILSTHREGEGFDAYLEIQRGNARAIREAFESARAGKDEH